MSPVDLAALKAALSDVPGIDTLSETIVGGRRVFGFAGLVAAVDPRSDMTAIEAAIRNAASMRTQGKIVATQAPSITTTTPLPQVLLTPAPAQPQGKPMTTPAPGSFAASIKAMMDEARAGVAQARADGLAKVTEAVGKLHDAKAATAKVASNMVQTIEDEAAAAMSELGQISNDLA